MKISDYVPPIEGGRHIDFGADPVLVHVPALCYVKF